MKLQEELKTDLKVMELQKPKAQKALKRVETLEPLESVSVAFTPIQLETLTIRESTSRDAIGQLELLQADTERALNTSLKVNEALTLEVRKKDRDFGSTGLLEEPL